MLMVPFIVIMVLIELGTGARRTETRISIDEGPFTFVFITEIQRQGEVNVQSNGTVAHHSNNGTHDEHQHNRPECEENREDPQAKEDEAKEDSTVERENPRMEDRLFDDESHHYDDSPTEEADDEDSEEEDDSEDDDGSEDDDSRPDRGLHLDKSEPHIDDALDLVTDIGVTAPSSYLATQGDIYLASESSNSRNPHHGLTSRPRMSPVPVPVAFRQENMPPLPMPALPAMINTVFLDGRPPSQSEFPTLTAESKKEMPFAVMQSNIFDLNEDSTETEGSGLDF